MHLISTTLNGLLLLNIAYGATIGFKLGALKSSILLIGAIISISIAKVYYLTISDELKEILELEQENYNQYKAYIETIIFILIFLLPYSIFETLAEPDNSIGEIWGYSNKFNRKSRLIGAIINTILTTITLGFILLMVEKAEWRQINNIINSSPIANTLINLSAVIQKLITN